MKSINPIIHYSTTPRPNDVGGQAFLHSSKLIILFFILHFAFFNFHCKKPTPPDIDDTPKPGKRDYKWTIDTLAYPGSFQTLMRDIWASSPTNVYVVGHNDQPGPGTMFRYDGTSWKTTRFHVADGGNVSGAVSLSAIHGIGPNDIYAVGESIYENPAPPPNFLDSSLIIHFDGNLWREILVERGRNLQTVRPGVLGSVWAGGMIGTLYKNEHNTWTKLNTDTTLWFNYFAEGDNNTYALAYTPITVSGIPTVHYLLRWASPLWKVVDSFSVLNAMSAPFGHSSMR
ncbi:MAG: hypothetical protein QME58_04690, partial [Bacteroidota bacterium]|nr:hypothetical protein [Bacteroidota bacterium]